VEVSADDLLAILNAKVKKGSPVAANRVRALVSRIFYVWSRAAPRSTHRESGHRREEADEGGESESRPDVRRDPAYLGRVRYAEPVRKRLIPFAPRNGATRR